MYLFVLKIVRISKGAAPPTGSRTHFIHLGALTATTCSFPEKPPDFNYVIKLSKFPPVYEVNRSLNAACSYNEF